MTVGGITLLIGGVRAGKSAKALALAAERRGDGAVLFVATAQAHDEEMRRRIDAHRRERAKDWETLESPIALVGDISARVESTNYSVVIVDCLTLWVSNILLTLSDDADAEAVIADHATKLLGVLADLARRGTRIILVTNEVGLGIVPPTPLGRRYRDALGRVNQLTAESADETSLMVAGLELRLR